MHNDGFWIEQSVLTPSECDSLIRVLVEYALKRGRAGARNLMALDDVWALANDSRLLRIAAHAFDKPLIPYRATFFDKSVSANWLVAWHQDGPPARRASPFKRVGALVNKVWCALRPGAYLGTLPRSRFANSFG